SSVIHCRVLPVIEWQSLVKRLLTWERRYYSDAGKEELRACLGPILSFHGVVRDWYSIPCVAQHLRQTVKQRTCVECLTNLFISLISLVNESLLTWPYLSLPHERPSITISLYDACTTYLVELQSSCSRDPTVQDTLAKSQGLRVWSSVNKK
ncbi:hypothetical protein OS493_040632, partial [Desmophyllum pertusum]